jgi:hypothetical protein
MVHATTVSASLVTRDLHMGRSMMNNDLTKLYESTEKALIYGVGLIQLTDAKPTPFIHIHYRDWSREKLKVVRESFKSGLILVSAERKPGQHYVYIGTKETIAIQQREGEHTSILRAPAWDAQLAAVEDRAFRLFEANRKRYGGFLLLVQTPEWEFLTAVEDADDRVIVGEFLMPSMPGIPTGR